MKDELPQLLPAHLGIIMDGNGRWAKRRGLPRSAGHAAGAANFKKITRDGAKSGSRYLPVYACPTENWTRPAEEVSALMTLFRKYLEEALRDFRDDDIVVRFLGDTAAFPPELQTLIRETEEISAARTGMVLNIAMNYGGRAELVRAVRSIAERVRAGELAPDAITEETVSSALYTAGQPDPDLIIRPSGEHRTSNFLLWQSAYAEYVIMDVLWPDFGPDDLNAALREYANRSRRFGGV